MNVKLPVIDDLAWAIVKIGSLFQALLFEQLQKLANPRSIKNKIWFMQVIYSGYYIWSTPKEELPDIVQAQLLRQGRFVIFLVVGLTLFDTLKDIIG